jgi:hypothetical protein
MLISDSFYCGYRYFCTCFLQHLHKVLCCCSGIDLHFSHQSTFISRRQNASPSWAVWRLRGPMVLILVYYCLYRWTWYLQAFGNCSQGWFRLVEVYICIFTCTNTTVTVICCPPTGGAIPRPQPAPIIVVCWAEQCSNVSVRILCLYNWFTFFQAVFSMEQDSLKEL